MPTIVHPESVTTTLPEITLNLGEICRVVENSFYDRPPLALMGDALAGKSIMGVGHPINLDEAKQAARARGMNLDGYLTAQVANYISNFGDRKSPVLIWYAIRNTAAFLFVSARKEVIGANFEGAAEPPSADIVFPDADPFMYYAGQAGNGDMFRVYYRHSENEAATYHLYDAGAFSLYRLLSSAERETYDHICQSPLEGDHIFYTPVPRESSFTVEWSGRQIRVNRAFCKLRFGDTVSP